MTILFLFIPLVYIGYREFLFYKEREQWQKERQMLLDRIQAKDFTEYKAFTEPVKKKEEKEEDGRYVQL